MISPNFWNAYEYFRQTNFAVPICWAARKGLDLLQVDLDLTRAKKRANEVTFIEFTEKKYKGLLESLRRVLKKLKVRQSEHFLGFLENLLFFRIIWKHFIFI